MASPVLVVPRRLMIVIRASHPLPMPSLLRYKVLGPLTHCFPALRALIFELFALLPGSPISAFASLGGFVSPASDTGEPFKTPHVFSLS